MTKQNCYEQIPNFDYSSTYEKLRNSSVFTSLDDVEKAGIVAKYKDTEITIQISPYGTPNIWYKEDKEKQQCFDDLQKVLGIRLKPTKANVWNIPYPAPPSFSLSFCDAS